MKKMWIFIFFLVMLVPIKSRAYVNYQDQLDWIDSSCLNNNKCIALCSYHQVMQNTPAAGVASTSYYSGVYIYYYFDGKYQVSWDKGFGEWSSPGKTITKKGKVGDVFTDVVFISDDRYKELTNNAKCPKYAYVDTGGGNSEICFDNGKYCSGKNGFLTQFISNKQQQYSDYDINSDLENYFKNWSPSEDVCTSLDNCNLDKIKNQFDEDFSKNFLHGNKIPSIIQNNPVYENGINSIEKKYGDIKEKLIGQIKNDNTLTESQKQQKIDSINKMVDQAVVDFKQAVKENSEAIDDGQKIDDPCEVVPPEIKTWIINILKIVRYIALALVIVLGALDFLKAAGSGEPDQMKKAGQSFLKRAIAVAVLFLLPYIVELVLGLIDMFGVNTNCVDPGSI